MKQLYESEDGAALILALMALMITSILGAAALTVAGGTINQTVWDRSSNQAFAIAEAGFDKAVARIRNEELAEMEFTTRLLNGEAKVTMTKINMMMYLVKSVGAQPSLADPKARRAVEAIIVHLDPSDVFFADGAQGTVVGNASLDGPFYSRDVLKISGDANWTGGPFFIKDDAADVTYGGDLLLEGASTMGTAAEPVYLFVDGYYDQTLEGGRLNTVQVFSDVPDLEMPIINTDNLDEQVASADLVIDDTSAVINGSFNWGASSGGGGSSSTGMIFGNQSPSDSWGTAGSGYLEWDKPSKTLTIDGKVFVDGHISFTIDVTYRGTGTLVANTDIAIEGSFVPHDLTHFPDRDAIGLISPDTLSVHAKNNDEVYAFAYAFAKADFKWGHDFYGNVTTGMLDFGQGSANPSLHITTNVDPNDMPPGMPEIDSITSVTGWREVQP